MNVDLDDKEVNFIIKLVTAEEGKSDQTDELVDSILIKLAL